jgi:hypothetical protein
MHETIIDHFYTLGRNQNVSSHWANFCLRNFFLSVCSSLYSFMLTFNKKNLCQFWSVKKKTYTHPSPSSFLTCISLDTMSTRWLSMLLVYLQVESLKMVGPWEFLYVLGFSWLENMISNVQHVWLHRFSSGRLLMHAVRGKEIAPCYYPYQTTQHPSDDDIKTSCIGTGRTSRQRSPTKDDLSPSRCWWF